MASPHTLRYEPAISPVKYLFTVNFLAAYKARGKTYYKEEGWVREASLE